MSELTNIQLSDYSPDQCGQFTVSWDNGVPPLRLQAFSQADPNYSAWFPIPAMFANLNSTTSSNSSASEAPGAGGTEALSDLVVGPDGGQADMKVVAKEGVGVWIEITDHTGMRAQTDTVAIVGPGQGNCLVGLDSASPGAPFFFVAMGLAGVTGFLLLCLFFTVVHLRRARRRLRDAQLAAIHLPDSPLSGRRTSRIPSRCAGDDEAALMADALTWEKERSAKRWQNGSVGSTASATSQSPYGQQRTAEARRQQSSGSLASDPFTDWRATSLSPVSAGDQLSYSPLRSAPPTTAPWQPTPSRPAHRGVVTNASLSDPVPSNCPPSSTIPIIAPPAVSPSTAPSPPPPEAQQTSHSTAHLVPPPSITFQPTDTTLPCASSTYSSTGGAPSAEWHSGDDGARLSGSSRSPTLINTEPEPMGGAAPPASEEGPPVSESGTYESDEFWRRRRSRHSGAPVEEK